MSRSHWAGSGGGAGSSTDGTEEAGESATTSGCATRNTDGTFDFPATGGTYDAAAGTAEVRYGGTVVFSYPAHFFEITLANPTVKVTAGGTGSLLADVDLVAYNGETQQHLDQATVIGSGR